MSDAMAIGFACCLFGIVMFAAKLVTKGKEPDVLALIGLCVTAGYLGHWL